ncbi:MULTISPECIES: TMEM165/GDT1 family protein [Sphingomonas]|uniref:GDT1 family protein n=1 Tax=Sphingomonas molluscorum TaxID=418184 RepID=A0ABU8Q2W1_9SPHN|nr:TMEM165/GDT1 family protein [Sphingomonas sp. JUb134]MBM7405468.1 putative Ca2+/H+ antiporter (TMEM165/GDT1 family) [Sphingomonas sp. JUb134]
METLVPAFVAVLLAQLFDPPARLAAVLADRFGRAGVTAGLILAHVAGFLAAAAGGALIAPGMSPNARVLLLALALIFAGAGGLARTKLADRLTNWRIGSFATAFLGIFILAFGDRSQFLALALAAWSGSPVLAAIGSTVAGVAVGAIAATVGERAWCRWPGRRAAGLGVSALLVVAGAVLAVRALRLG